MACSNFSLIVCTLPPRSSTFLLLFSLILTDCCLPNSYAPMVNNMETNGLHIEEPALIADDGLDESNVLTTDTATTVDLLRPERVRWFYKSDPKKWTKFDGFDSLNIEYRYRANFGNEEEASCLNGSFNYYFQNYTVVVRGGLYEVDLLKKKCTSIFWPGKWMFYFTDY